jgi:hypothetical protein
MRILLTVILFVASVAPVYASTHGDQEPQIPICPVYAEGLVRTFYDLAVTQGIESRTWFIGPMVAQEVEPYIEGGYTHRNVTYYEKGREECTPAIIQGEFAGMTWGHLATELMTGRVQVSHTEFEDHEPSEVHVAGDPGFDEGPTYRTMGQVVDEPAREPGTVISESIKRDGTIDTDARFADYGVIADYYVPETDHTIAAPFWSFMTGTYMRSRYPVAGFEERDFYPESIEIIGFPTTEAYWTTVPVAGEMQDVLVQCFERRCLTYTPGNPDGWQVEMANIGLHYYQWRYPDQEF